MPDPTSPTPSTNVPDSPERAADRASPRITMVKKRLSSGEACGKCVQAEALLKDKGLWERIDEVVWADENDPESPGMRLGAAHGVKLAPFFLVDRPGEAVEVITSTLKLTRLLEELRQASGRAAGEREAPSQGIAISAESLSALRTKLAHASPQGIVREALTLLGKDCWIAFSGAEDVVVIDLAKSSGLPFSVFCLDTGRLHAETYAFLDRVRRHYDIELEVVSPDAPSLQAFVRKKGLFSFYDDGHHECCGVRKVEPLRRALGPAKGWMSGQRKDQSPDTRATLAAVELDTGTPNGPRLKFNPLAEWTSEQVWQYIRDNGVPYNSLHDAGFVSIGCQPCTRARRPGEHERAARWWWEESTQRECGLHTRKP